MASQYKDIVNELNDLMPSEFLESASYLIFLAKHDKDQMKQKYGLSDKEIVALDNTINLMLENKGLTRTQIENVVEELKKNAIDGGKSQAAFDPKSSPSFLTRNGKGISVILGAGIGYMASSMWLIKLIPAENPNAAKTKTVLLIGGAVVGAMIGYHIYVSHLNKIEKTLGVKTVR